MLQFLQFAMVRAAMALFTLLTVSLIVFTLMELVPGTCAERYLAFKNTQGSGISVAGYRGRRTPPGLDRPFLVRWGSWVGNVFFKGEFGDSCILRLEYQRASGRQVPDIVGICLTSLFVAYLIAIPVGIISASSDSAALNNRCGSCQLSGPGDAELPSGADDHADRTVLFGDSLTGLFSNEFRDAEWSWAG